MQEKDRKKMIALVIIGAFVTLSSAQFQPQPSGRILESPIPALCAQSKSQHYVPPLSSSHIQTVRMSRKNHVKTSKVVLNFALSYTCLLDLWTLSTFLSYKITYIKVQATLRTNYNSQRQLLFGQHVKTLSLSERFSTNQIDRDDCRNRHWNIFAE